MDLPTIFRNITQVGELGTANVAQHLLHSPYYHKIVAVDSYCIRGGMRSSDEEAYTSKSWPEERKMLF